MSVPETQRQKGKLEVLTKAKEVTVYSGRILANQKKFDPAYDDFLVNDIKIAAKNIYRYARLANDIRVTGKETALARRKLQTEAIRACEDMLINIEIAYQLYHLEGKRVEHWTNMVVESKKGLRAWRDSDRSRYKEHYDSS